MSLISDLAVAPVASPPGSARVTPPNEAALRQIAAQFESLLLTQLTASLNPKEEEGEEDALFSNSGGGMGLARQMYSEQLAKTMSNSGGIGIANMIIDQVLKRNTQPAKNHASERALSATRAINNEPARPAAAATTRPVSGSTRDLYPEARIISEAVPSTEPTTPTANAAASTGLRFNSMNPTAIGATRPRRVHAVSAASDSPAVRPTARHSALRGLSATNNSRPVAAHVAHVAFHAPVRGAIHSEYGMRRDPINGRMRLHQGIDIAARRGTPIEAAASGTVVFAGRNKGYGNMVMIEHADGRRTLYAHAEALFVRAGDTVAAGQTIAAVGSTGHSTGPHLHFEVRENNRSVNPLGLLANEIAVAHR